jgi:hypothetical protein
VYREAAVFGAVSAAATVCTAAVLAAAAYGLYRLAGRARRHLDARRNAR